MNPNRWKRRRNQARSVRRRPLYLTSLKRNCFTPPPSFRRSAWQAVKFHCGVDYPGAKKLSYSCQNSHQMFPCSISDFLVVLLKKKKKKKIPGGATFGSRDTGYQASPISLVASICNRFRDIRLVLIKAGKLIRSPAVKGLISASRGGIDGA